MFRKARNNFTVLQVAVAMICLFQAATLRAQSVSDAKLDQVRGGGTSRHMVCYNICPPGQASDCINNAWCNIASYGNCATSVTTANPRGVVKQCVTVCQDLSCTFIDTPQGKDCGAGILCTCISNKCSKQTVVQDIMMENCAWIVRRTRKWRPILCRTRCALRIRRFRRIILVQPS